MEQANMTSRSSSILSELTTTEARTEFVGAVEAYELWEQGEPEPSVEIGGLQIPISRVFRELSTYTDLMPNHVADWVQDFAPEGKLVAPTYGSAARCFQRLIAAELTK